MKNILKLSALLVLFYLSACNDDNELSKKEQYIEMLTTTSWAHAVVTHGTDGDLSDQYADFIIAFSKTSSTGYDGTFIVSNGGYAFPENAGKWKFNDNLTTITLDSGRELEFELSKTNLMLDFTVAPSGGRVEGISGQFTFELQPL